MKPFTIAGVSYKGQLLTWMHNEDTDEAFSNWSSEEAPDIHAIFPEACQGLVQFNVARKALVIPNFVACKERLPIKQLSLPIFSLSLFTPPSLPSTSSNSNSKPLDFSIEIDSVINRDKHPELWRGLLSYSRFVEMQQESAMPLNSAQSSDTATSASPIIFIRTIKAFYNEIQEEYNGQVNPCKSAIIEQLTTILSELNPFYRQFLLSCNDIKREDIHALFIVYLQKAIALCMQNDIIDMGSPTEFELYSQEQYQEVFGQAKDDFKKANDRVREARAIVKIGAFLSLIQDDTLIKSQNKELGAFLKLFKASLIKEKVISTIIEKKLQNIISLLIQEGNYSFDHTNQVIKLKDRIAKLIVPLHKVYIPLCFILYNNLSLHLKELNYAFHFEQLKSLTGVLTREIVRHLAEQLKDELKPEKNDINLFFHEEIALDLQKYMTFDIKKNGIKYYFNPKDQTLTDQGKLCAEAFAIKITKFITMKLADEQLKSDSSSQLTPN